jgi:hypothetical protein
MTKTFIILLFTTLFSLSAFAQTSVVCKNEIFIRNDNKTDISKIPTADKYKLLDKVDADIGCAAHTIIKDSADYFLIYDKGQGLKAIWLFKTDLIRIAVRHMAGKLIFYTSADTKSKILHDLDIDKNKLFDVSAVVLNCKTGWYKIKLQLKGHLWTGWVKADDLCPNPCSTCS